VASAVATMATVAGRNAKDARYRMPQTLERVTEMSPTARPSIPD